MTHDELNAKVWQQPILHATHNYYAINQYLGNLQRETYDEDRTQILLNAVKTNLDELITKLQHLQEQWPELEQDLKLFQKTAILRALAQ